MERQFIPQHNVLVDLDVTTRGAARVSRILTFLARSRIRYAVTESPALSHSILSQFWDNIQYDSSVTPPVIKTKVNNRPVIFSAAHLRDILRLGSFEQEDGPTCYSQAFIRGALGRMGYVGSETDRQFNKGFVYGQWRFLFHVLVTIFGSTKGNSDVLSPKLLSALLSLVYNKPYSFSKYLFGELRRQINAYSGLKFLLYPRFCMLIVRHCISDVAPLPDLSVDVIGASVYDRMFHGSAVRDIQFLQRKPLFGHLVHSHYVAPPGDSFMDYDVYTSSSDDEDIDPMFPGGDPQDDLEFIPSPTSTSSIPVNASESAARPIPVTERIRQLEEQVQELQDLVQIHSEDRLQVWNALSVQNRAYSQLVEIHREDSMHMQHQIDELSHLVSDLLRTLPSQGELGSTSRRPSE